MDKELKKEFKDARRKRKAQVRYEKYKFHPRCEVTNIVAKDGGWWRVAFWALVSSVISYFGILQLVIPMVVAAFAINPTFIILSISLFGIGYVVVLVISVKYHSFNATNILIFYILIMSFTSTGVVAVLASLVPIPSMDILRLFVVLFPINVLLYVVAFYSTRWVMCRGDKDTSSGDGEHEWDRQWVSQSARSV